MARGFFAAFVIAAAFLAVTVVLVPTAERDASAQTSGICGRNSEIQRLILAELARLQTAGSITNAPTTCGAVTSADLTAIRLLATTLHPSLSPALNIGALTSGDFAGLTSTTGIILINTGITSIGADTFSELIYLDRLDLVCNDFSASGAISDNAFRGVSASASAGRQVILDLGSNGFTSLSVDLFRPYTRLTNLKLGVHIPEAAIAPACPDKPQNVLRSLPVDLFRYNTDLEILDLTNAGLTAIDKDQFKYNAKLRFMNLADNALASMPTTVFDANPWLSHVELQDNLFTAMDANWLQDKKWLEYIDIRDNLITTIPANWLSGSMRFTGHPSQPESEADPAAGQLYMGRNPLTAMHEDAFSSPHTISATRLNLNETHLIEMPVIDGLTELTTLDMRTSRLSVLRENDFAYQSKLTRMDLRSSLISEIEPGAFNGLSSLRSLYLLGNRITEIKAGVFTNLPKLAILWIHGNPYTKIADDTFDGSWDPDAPYHQLALYFQRIPPVNPIMEVPTGFFKDFPKTPQFLAVNRPPAPDYDLPIYVYVVDSNTAKLYMPTGAPTDFTVDLAAVGATLTDSGGDPVTSVSFRAGDQFSEEEFDFTPEAADSRPTITLTPQFTRPPNHYGYQAVARGQTPPANAEAFSFDNAITLRWDGPDANNLVYVYQYRYRPMGQTWSEWIDHAVQAEMPRQLATIDGLASMTTYEIDLRTVSIRGTSEPALLSATTGLLEFDPGEADADGISLELSAVGGIEIIDLTWNMPSSTEPIVSYRHRHRVSGTTEWSSWTVESVRDLDAAGDPLMYTSTIWGLEPATTYLVQLQALQEGTLPSHSATATATTIWTFPEINKIEPHIRHFTVHTGGRVRLTVNVYDRQDGLANAKADSMIEEFAAVRTRYIWSDGGSGGEFDTPSDTRMIYYTAPDDPGMHTITAGVSPPGLCVGQLEMPRPIPDPCVATFTVHIVTYETDAEQAETPVNPSGAIPTSITDLNGMAYATASPVEGGAFMDPESAATLAVPPNAVPNMQLIGVRVDRSPLAMMTVDATGRFAIAADIYIVSAIDGQGVPVMGYTLEEPARVCVPVPDGYRAQLSDISTVRLHSASEAGESVEVLRTTLLAGMSGEITACGAISELPARVAAARFGADQVTSGETSAESETGLPETGGNAPTATWLLLAMVVGVGMLGVWEWARRNRTRLRQT